MPDNKKKLRKYIEAALNNPDAASITRGNVRSGDSAVSSQQHLSTLFDERGTFKGNKESKTAQNVGGLQVEMRSWDLKEYGITSNGLSDRQIFIIESILFSAGTQFQTKELENGHPISHPNTIKLINQVVKDMKLNQPNAFDKVLGYSSTPVRTTAPSSPLDKGKERADSATTAKPPLERRYTYVGMPVGMPVEQAQKSATTTSYIRAGSGAKEELARVRVAQATELLQTEKDTAPAKKSTPPIPDKTGAALEMANRLKAERVAREAIMVNKNIHPHIPEHVARAGSASTQERAPSLKSQARSAFNTAQGTNSTPGQPRESNISANSPPAPDRSKTASANRSRDPEKRRKHATHEEREKAKALRSEARNLFNAQSTDTPKIRKR